MPRLLFIVVEGPEVEKKRKTESGPSEPGATLRVTGSSSKFKDDYPRVVRAFLEG